MSIARQLLALVDSRWHDEFVHYVKTCEIRSTAFEHYVELSQDCQKALELLAMFESAELATLLHRARGSRG